MTDKPCGPSQPERWEGPQGHKATCPWARGRGDCGCGWNAYCDRKKPSAAPRGTSAAIERGWLIERRNPEPEWLEAWSGGYEWTKDSLKAIRFCRREDANQIAEIFEDEDIHITEHQWG